MKRVPRLYAFRPGARGVEYAQYFDALFAYAVRNHVGKIRQDEFPYAGHSSRATQIGMRRQELRGVMHLFDEFCGSLWVVLCDEFGFGMQILQSAPQPFNLHGV